MVDFSKLVIPNKSDPNNIGEIFREVFFTDEGYGCYENFNLIEGFKQIETGNVYHETLDKLVDFEDREYYKPSIFVNDVGYVVAWFWDGDGTLYFKIDDFELINDDCKKSHNWKWFTTWKK